MYALKYLNRHLRFVHADFFNLIKDLARISWSRSALGGSHGAAQQVVSDDLNHPLKRRRGRPAGKKMVIAAEQLRLHHFSLVRALIQGIALRSAWERYLAFEDGPDDERHFAARLRDLLVRIRAAATERGLHSCAQIALDGLEPRVMAQEAAITLPSPAAPTPAAAPSPAVPSLDEWIEERCEEQGIDFDVYTQAEWLADYEAEFGLDRPLPQLSASALAAPSPLASSPTPPRLPVLNDRLAALNELATALAQPPALTDSLGVWLSTDLAARLAGTTVGGKLLPLVSLSNLISFINLYRHRWWEHVPRLGAERAARIVAWLHPLAESLGETLLEEAVKPLQLLTLERQRSLSRLDEMPRYGIVPLDRLAVPPELSGQMGLFRTGTPNVFNVDTDIEAILAWLRRYQASPRTFSAYGLIVERLYLWALLLKRKPLSSLTESDYHDYRDFLAKPPADWIQRRRADRCSSDWRPFKGPLSATSRKQNFTVIASMLRALIDAGYLSANAARGVLPSMKLPQMKMNIDRSFNESQWAWVMKCLNDITQAQEQRLSALNRQENLSGDRAAALKRQTQHARYQAATLHRTRLVLELGASTGLRLLELVTTRRGAITRELVDGQSVWIMKVLGKGNKIREVLIFDHVKALIDQHHRDMEMVGTNFDPTNFYVRELRNPVNWQQVEAPSSTDPSTSMLGDGVVMSEEFDPANLPLIGALRKGPPRWQNDPFGVAVLVRNVPLNTDRHGSLDPTALYQAIKRFLAKCADMAEMAGEEIDHTNLRRASTHWLRHFFANSAVSDGVDVVAVRDAMGHASIATTSLYLRTERKRLVSEVSRLRRRS